jgi:uncharacterized membrane protein YdbT with pleckstrin-like domain
MQGEETLTVTRQHWSMVAPALAAIGVLAAVALVVIFLIPGHIGQIDFAGVRGMVAFAVVVVALLFASVRYLAWRCTTYVLTSRRIILERGVLSRNLESIALDRIQNTIIHRPLGDRVIGAGDIEIESAGRDGTERLHRVPHCERFYAELLQAIDGGRQPGPSASGNPPAQRSGL